ncbi:MAG: hypothetical protein LBP79_05995 [Clostridiales bacterium]|jgi:hypothetical protein|nr:hypothetical protein [Clostridiales bacterium]
MRNYTIEIDGQREFYSRIGVDPDLSHNTDGVDKGNLYEHKLNIDNINKVLFQAVKYASRIRERGEKLPANLILNDLNKEVCYIFQAQDLLSEIEKIYFGAASKGNDTFVTTAIYTTIDYSKSQGLAELLNYVNSENFVKYHIDRNNILGLSRQFYKHNQSKDAFIKGESAEIRNPNILADRVYPYTKSDNLEFGNIMDCLNPQLLQREQGAYYTPIPYVRKMHEMLFKAINEIPNGMDYVIIDRCAGVGNLQENLPDEILEHCIMSTIEPNEYMILRYKFGDKGVVVVPETDALAYDIIPASHNEQGVADDYIREKVNDKNCAVILMENPPFSDAGSGAVQNTGKKDNLWKKSFVIQEMKKEIKGVATNELANLFIWSGFKKYLTKPQDSYILYSPTKYWRNQQLVNKQFADGFLCNRKEFHDKKEMQASAMGCIWWRNIDDNRAEQLTLTPYDIVSSELKIAAKDVVLRKAHKMLSAAYDLRKFDDDKDNGVLFESNGCEFANDGRQIRTRGIYNTNIIGYLVADSFLIDRKHIELIRGVLYRGNGFYLRADNFIEKLPLFVAAAFPYSDYWYTTDTYSKSYDGRGKHLQDREFLKRCLIYTALTPKNKCRSLQGSDNRFYKNELCFDKDDTLASIELQKFINNGFILNDYEETLLKYWKDVLFEARKTQEYKNMPSAWRLGFWQIKEEINIKIEQGLNRKGEPNFVYKYPTLNTEVLKLEKAIKRYYNDFLTKLVFKYELVK